MEEGCVKKKGGKMGRVGGFGGEDEGLKGKITKIGQDQNIKDTNLAIDNPAGPQKYNVSKDADVTVVLYLDHEVKANYAYKKGDLTEKDIEKVVNDLPKILPSK